MTGVFKPNNKTNKDKTDPRIPIQMKRNNEKEESAMSANATDQRAAERSGRLNGAIKNNSIAPTIGSTSPQAAGHPSRSV